MVFEEVSRETLVRNARLADSKRDSWRKSRAKCLFRDCTRALLEEVSYETLVLQTRGSKPRLCPAADLRGLGGKCVWVAPCDWQARNLLV